ncbi:glycosyltransferase [Spongiimicrobium salis]|uniref:glycosyltransferase n=1 Tax=Spongiimicrobium salis TaxID=1667022 RepID=UPI00374D0E20
MNYCIIIPAHNEEAFLASCLDAILIQTRLPQKVVVVNDNSTDRTAAIASEFMAKSDIFERVDTTSSNVHMPGSKVINAFYKGIDRIPETYDFIVKLDADIILPADYFERIASVFEEYPQVGIAGGFAYEQNKNGDWELNHPMNKDHVRGAFKAYSKTCFQAIGGLKNAMGWDTVDELLAQYHGYEIHTVDQLKTKHLRPLGKAYNKKAKLLQGQAMYTMRYGFWISCIASLKMAWNQKKINAFFDNMKGYHQAKKKKVPFLVTVEEGAFIRKLRWTNIKKKIVRK